MDTDNEDFVISGCDVQEHPDGKRLRLTFVGEGDKTRSVVMNREGVPLLVGALHSKIGHGTVVPIDKDSLRAGTNIQVQGWDLTNRPDRSVRLTIYVDMIDQGRVVTIPVELSRENVTALIHQMSLPPA